MRRVPHRLIEGCLIAAHAIGSKHVFIYIRGEYLAEFEILQRCRRRGARRGAARRRHARPAPRRRRVHLRRGVRAARVARGQARPAAPAAALPAGPGPVRVADADQQRPDDRDGPDRSSSAAAPEFAKLGARGLARHARLLDLRQRRATGELRAPARNDAARADLRPRRRHPRRPQAEGGHPGRLVGAGASRRTRSTRRSTTTRSRRAGSFFGSAAVIVVDDRGCMVQLALRVDEVLHARVVRQVHAVPRGHALDGAAPGEDRERPTRSTPTSTCCATSATASSASRSARSATSPSTRSRATWTSTATSSRRTSTRAAARSAASRRSRASWRRSTSTPTTDAEVPRDRRGQVLHRHRVARQCAVQDLTPEARERRRARHRRRPRGSGAEGHRARRDGARGRDRDPRLLLRAAARRAGRRLPHVPRRGRGDAEARRPAAR